MSTVFYCNKTNEVMIVDTSTRHPWYLFGSRQLKFHRYTQFSCGTFAWSTAYKSAVKIGDL